MKSKKGFSLVEVIVVITILSILAAISIPSIMNFYKENQEEQYLHECKEVVKAVKSELSSINVELSDNGYKEGEDKDTIGKAILQNGDELVDRAGRDGKITALALSENENKLDIQCLFYKIGSSDKEIYVYYSSNEGYSICKDDVCDGIKCGSGGNVDDYNEELIDKTLEIMKDVLKDFKNTTQSDSSAYIEGVTQDGSSTKAIIEALKGVIDLGDYNIAYWRIEYIRSSKTGFFYWTDVPFTTDDAGKQIPVMRYNLSTGTYTVWIGKVSVTQKSDYTDQPYAVLTAFTGYAPSTGQIGGAAVQTLEDCQEKYQQAKDKYIK